MIPSIRTILLSFIISLCCIIVYNFYSSDTLSDKLFKQKKEEEIPKKPSKSDKKLNITPLYKETFVAFKNK